MKGIVLFGHGSRDAAWRQPIEAVAARIAAQADAPAVRCAYLELCAPDFATATAELVELGVTELRVLPMFLGMGRHAREDLPALVHVLQERCPHLSIQVLPPVGEHPGALDLFAQLATL
ncbi:sirohydrochlorin chelatase [Pseudorhodoferax sp. Leaf274]|uniref:sirohydrochlorin chelatase n=1 Tax=Pseudorhodoferax sp. Leaf274 TaxID=1736318 RepID=UPI000702486F|nr:CbiX/SirB N-terminal domain-containing protein [Pseudorhodoferax sp. Leaf274]KQP35229.1 cobalamin biosynthesis protein CbiX [Pseudorhodoferax sp. Leaf274]